MTDGNFADRYPRGTELLLEVLPEMQRQLSPIECRALFRLDNDLDMLAGNGIGNSRCLRAENAGKKKRDTLYLAWHNLEPTDVDDLDGSPDHFEEIAA